jgi:hypothetical protein
VPYYSHIVREDVSFILPYVKLEIASSDLEVCQTRGNATVYSRAVESMLKTPTLTPTL